MLAKTLGGCDVTVSKRDPAEEAVDKTGSSKP